MMLLGDVFGINTDLIFIGALALAAIIALIAIIAGHAKQKKMRTAKRENLVFADNVSRLKEDFPDDKSLLEEGTPATFNSNQNNIVREESIPSVSEEEISDNIVAEQKNIQMKETAVQEFENLNVEKSEEIAVAPAPKEPVAKPIPKPIAKPIAKTISSKATTTAATKTTTSNATPAKTTATKATPANVTPAKTTATKATPAKATPAKATTAKATTTKATATKVTSAKATTAKTKTKAAAKATAASTTAPKTTATKATAAKTNEYRVTYDSEAKEWTVKKDGAKRVIRRVSTKEEAVSIAKSFANEGNVTIHKKDGKFQKY